MAPIKQITFKKPTLQSVGILIIMLALFFSPITALADGIPERSQPDFSGFVESVQNGKTGVLRGLYVKNLMAFPIIQQPIGNDSFVSPAPGYVTEFRMANNHGTIGILAHNYLAGQSFFALSPGQEIQLVYGNAKTEIFVVTNIQKYQALSPNSPSGDFINLDTRERITASSLFLEIYGNQSGALILQTCIAANNNLTWGRLFVTAKPINQVYPNFH